MKACGLKQLLLILTIPLPVFAGIIESVEFDYGKLRIDQAENTLGYGELESIRDAGFPSVPYDRIYIYCNNNAIYNNISVVTISADTIEIEFQPQLNIPDKVTSDLDLRALQPSVLDREESCYPAEPILVNRQTHRGQAFWSILVFPIQYLDDGRIIFNHRIEVRADDAEFSVRKPVDLADDEFLTGSGPVYMKSPSCSTETGCPIGMQYVIVTSPELVDSFDSFLDMKNKTGFDAAVAITDSIFAWYDGIDEAEKLRNYLRDFYQAGGEYVLLGGDEDHVPIRYAFYYNTDILPELDQLMICDLYFADYDGDWDADGDGIWGEPTSDLPDLGAEVALGRIPFSQPSQVAAYTEKLRNYLFDPGGGDRRYLGRSVFITSDQMLDYFGETGQQYYVAERFPVDFEVSCDRLAEAPTGVAPAPTGPFPSETITDLDNGYGMINVLAHGRPDGFILNSSEYNLYPKSYLLTGSEHIGNGAFDDLASSQKPGFYYTISCTQGAFDLETSYSMEVPSVVEKLLEIDSAGAVGIIAFSRWGWVGSSYRIMSSFYEHLFGDADGYPVEAMYLTYLDYPFYLDQIYGQNYHGDPSLRLYLDTPTEMQLAAPAYYDPMQPLSCRLTLDGKPLVGQDVMIKIGVDTYESTVTGSDGRLDLMLPTDCAEVIEIVAFEPGIVSSSAVIYPSIAADADDDEFPLPGEFKLRQNYPNPFNPSTTIGFTLTRHQPVTLEIYDILGRIINRPLDGSLTAGEHQAVWDGHDFEGNEMSSGIYFYRLVSGEGTAVKKMMLIR